MGAAKKGGNFNTSSLKLVTDTIFPAKSQKMVNTSIITDQEKKEERDGGLYTLEFVQGSHVCLATCCSYDAAVNVIPTR